jgi:hypothetical protein
VFRGSAHIPNATKEQRREEIRRVRRWMNEVGGMAGRGWDGWGWGVFKDMCGTLVNSDANVNVQPNFQVSLPSSRFLNIPVALRL